MNTDEMKSVEMTRSADSILENLLDAVLVVDSRGYILYANRTAQELFSLSASELKGQSFGFPIVPNQRQEIEVFKEGELLTVQMLASHIHWGAQLASLLSLRDISEQKRIQLELAQQKELLEKTNEENEQYASLASHDLKEPIRKILYFSSHLLSGQQISGNERWFVEKIQSSAKRMSLLINGISELSRITHIKPSFKTVDMNQIVKEVINDLEFQIEERKATIEVSKLPIIDAIPSDMYQLIYNLISNALKYSRENIPPYIQIKESETDDGYVCIECIDNGIGFSNELNSKLFQPFHRLHPTKYDGMGIGLTICQKIVKVHHGQITAEGSLESGAAFRIKLPREQAKN